MDYLDAWEAECRDRQCSPATVKAYQQYLKHFLHWLNVPVCHVTREHLEAYRLHLVHLCLSAATVHYYLRCIQSFFKFLEESSYIFADPAKELVTPKPKQTLMPIPTEAEVRKLLMQPDVQTPLGIRDRALLETFYSSGIRLGEAYGLALSDVDLKQKILQVIGKGDKQRVVPIGGQAVFWLRKYIEDARPRLVRYPDHLFLWVSKSREGRLSVNSITHMFRMCSGKADMNPAITAHALRRACATHMLRRGAHPIEVQMLLGHEKTTTLSHYLKVTATDMLRMHKRSKLSK